MKQLLLFVIILASLALVNAPEAHAVAAGCPDGTNGNDVLICMESPPTSSNPDTHIQAGPGHDQIILESGVTVTDIYGDAPGDPVTGGWDTILLYGIVNGTVYGEGGNDWIKLNDGVDGGPDNLLVLDGGEGKDVLEFNFALSDEAIDLLLAKDPANGITSINGKYYQWVNFEALEITNHFQDSDNDGMSDAWEIYWFGSPANASGNGDADSDTLSNLYEFVYKTNPLQADSDGDGISDGEEVNLYGADPDNTDSDADGIHDGDEVNLYQTDPTSIDTDEDGLLDGHEILGNHPENPNGYTSNPTKADSDSDGLSDFDEIITHKTNPGSWDTDGDGLSDYNEIFTHNTNPSNADSDGDALNDGHEMTLHNTNPMDDDSDDDGLTDGAEVNMYGTNPLHSDSDGDELSDGDEINIYHTDPTWVDSDGDSLTDYDEVTIYGTNPTLADTDGDWYSDSDELMIYGTDPLVAESFGSISPSGTSNTMTTELHFHWMGLSNVEWYRLYFQKEGATNYLDKTLKAADVCEGTACSYDISDLLPRWGLMSGTYNWWVGAYVPEGGWRWNEKATYVVNIPAAAAPSNIVSDPRQGRPQIRWSEDPNTLWMQVWIGGADNGKSYNQWHELNGANKSFTCDAGMCSLEPVVDWPGGTYKVWLHAWGPGGESEWVQAPDLVLPGPPPMPTDLAVSGLHSSNPVFSWMPSEEATWYQVLVAPEDYAWQHKVWVLGYDISQACGDRTGVCSWSDPALDGILPARSYVFWLRAWGPGGMGEWTRMPGTFTYVGNP